MLRFPTKWGLLGVLAAITACADSPKNALTELSPITPDTGFVLTTSLFFTTSSLATFNQDPNALKDSLLVESGDAVLARLGSRLGVLNRGIESNLHLIGDSGQAGKQIALPNCGPHDALVLPTQEIVVSCYDSPYLQILSSDGNPTRSIDLSAFADNDGIPELDHMTFLNNQIYVTAQRLDRSNQFAPTGNGVLIVLDATTLEVVDTDETTPGLQGWELPCWDPYTRLYPSSSGDIFLACVGNFSETEQAKVLKIAPGDGEISIIADYESLGGFPSELVALSNDSLFTVVYTPSPESSFEAKEMSVVHINASQIEVVYSNPGFTLSGLGVDSQDNAYWGQRTTDDTSGIYRFNATTNAVEGPWKTSLPPMDFLFY